MQRIGTRSRLGWAAAALLLLAMPIHGASWDRQRRDIGGWNASWRGADWYGLPRNRDRLTLVKESWTVPADLPFGESKLVPMRAGEGLGWRFVDGV